LEDIFYCVISPVAPQAIPVEALWAYLLHCSSLEKRHLHCMNALLQKNKRAAG